MVKTLVLDAGHGGHDNGASGNGLVEKDLTLNLAKRIHRKLSHYKQIKVIMTRASDRFLTLTERANSANRNHADAFMSIHINAGGGTGFESYIYNGGVSARTRTLQDDVHDRIMKRLGVTNRGKKRANLAVLRQTTMPAILTENLFIDSQDAAKLKDSNFLEKIAQGHVDGILTYFNVKKRAHRLSSIVASDAVLAHLPNQANLQVDGKWGKATTSALQKAFGTPVDGIISRQPHNNVTQSLYDGTVQFGTGGSPVIQALQLKVDSKADGKLGPATVRALQDYLGTPVDGELSRPSVAVKEMQRQLNRGTF